MEQNSQTEFYEDNHGIFAGTIVNRYESGDTISFTIATHARGRNNVDNVEFPKISFFKEDHPEVADFRLHDYAMVHAHVTARVRNINKRSYIHQGLVGDSMEKMQTSFERFFGANVKSQTSDENIIRLHGKVTSVKNPKQNVVKINLDVVRGIYSDNIMVVSFRQRDCSILPDEMITVYGKVTTKLITKSGKRVNRESIVVSKIERD